MISLFNRMLLVAGLAILLIGTTTIATKQTSSVSDNNPKVGNPQNQCAVYPFHLPIWVKHGQSEDCPLTLENWNDSAINFSIAIEQDSYETYDWLITSGFESGVIPAGPGTSLEGIVTINALGTINEPGTRGMLLGRLIFTSNLLSSPDTLPISCIIADTLVLPEWDTLYAGCMALTVSNNGNMGNMGVGEVNLDFFNYGDCDFVEEGALDTVAGDASVYLYDGSPIICWQEGDSVVCNYSMFGSSYNDGHSFIAVGAEGPTDMGAYDLYHTEFMTRDSGIMIEQDIYAVHDGDTCEFFIKHLKISVIDGQTHTGLTIGEAHDWDIPSDSGNWNRSGFNHSRRLIYQVGSEIVDSLGDAWECQDNDLRYGGVTIYSSADNGIDSYDFSNAYTMDLSTQVYPTGQFVNDSLWKYMGDNVGYNISDSVDADLHTIWTYRNDYIIEPGDEFEIWTLYVTSKDGEADFFDKYDKGYCWVCQNLYCPYIPCNTGDINHNGTGPDIADLVYLVTYMFSGGPPPIWMPEADINGSGAGPDVTDLVYLVTYMFSGGPAPMPCY